MKTIGLHAIVVLLTYLVSVIISFRAVLALDFSKIFRKHHEKEAQILLILLALSLGYLVGTLLVTIIDQSLNLKMIFV